MDTINVCRIACGDKYIRKNFGGVFASDKLPSLKNNYVSFIVNLDPISLPGSHWVAVYFKGESAFFFDSYGKPPTGRILKFLIENSTHIFYNEIQYQDVNTVSCGYFCLYFLYKKSRNLNLSDLKENNQSYNERFIRHFAKTKLKANNCCQHAFDSSQTCTTKTFK